MVARIEEIAQKVASSDGLEVVEVELKGSGRNQMLRIYIDKPQGVTHADCESVSLQVGNASGCGGPLSRPLHAGGQFPGCRAKTQEVEGFRTISGTPHESCTARTLEAVQDRRQTF